METEIITAKELSRAAQIIREGGIVAFPTETVYGLGANALNPSAVEKIFLAKGRPQDNPLIVHLARLEDVFPLVTEVPSVFFELADRFMPGPLTVVLKKSVAVPSVVVANGSTVGIRFPSHPVARAFISECRCPIAAPSANTSTHVSPTTVQHVLDDLDGKIPMIIEGGSSDVGIESTVLDLTSEIPTILRPGAVTAEMLLQVFGRVDSCSVAIKVAKAPGMKYKHYAPRATAVLSPSLEAALELYDKKRAEGANPVLLCPEEKAHGRNCIDIGESGEQIAHNIYAALRSAETIYDFIIILKPSEEGIGNAVMNRLSKSTANE